MDESKPTPEADRPRDSEHRSMGLRLWVLVIPLALAAAILIPLGFDLHLLWGLPIYVVTGILTGLSFATCAAFKGKQSESTHSKQISEGAQLELEQTGS